jgi:hypothetical protein
VTAKIEPNFWYCYMLSSVSLWDLKSLSTELETEDVFEHGTTAFQDV